MPNYTFKNTITDETFDRSMSNAEREAFLNDTPQVIQVFKRFPAIGDSVRLGLRRPDDGFREVLQKAKSSHIHNTINDF
jgi:hypothetical protein